MQVKVGQEGQKLGNKLQYGLCVERGALSAVKPVQSHPPTVCPVLPPREGIAENFSNIKTIKAKIIGITPQHPFVLP